MMLRVLARLSDGGFVKIESDELAIWIRLRHENGGEADAAADVGHLGACGEFCRNAVQGGNPGLHNIIDIAGPKERAGRTEETPGRVAPAYPGSIAKRLLNLRFPFDHGRGQVEGTG